MDLLIDSERFDEARRVIDEIRANKDRLRTGKPFDVQAFAENRVTSMERNRSELEAEPSAAKENTIQDGGSEKAKKEQTKVKDSGEPSQKDTSPAASETAQSESAPDAANQSEASDDIEAQEGTSSEGMASDTWIQILIGAGLLVLFGGLLAVWQRNRRARR